MRGSASFAVFPSKRDTFSFLLNIWDAFFPFANTSNILALRFAAYDNCKQVRDCLPSYQLHPCCKNLEPLFFVLLYQLLPHFLPVLILAIVLMTYLDELLHDILLFFLIFFVRFCFSLHSLKRSLTYITGTTNATPITKYFNRMVYCILRTHSFLTTSTIIGHLDLFRYISFIVHVGL